MRLIIIFIVCSLFLGGCRFAIEAKELSLRISIDQAAYLSDADPALYESDPANDPDPVD